MNPAYGRQQQLSRYDPASSDACAAIQARVLAALGRHSGVLNVADVGCGSGSQCRLWAEQGHQVFGAEADQVLVSQARQRAHESGLEIVFDVACASALPWPDCSMDLVLAPAWLEHRDDWRACLAELVRVLKPGGMLYLNTSRLSAYGLHAHLAQHGLACLDHVDLAGLGAQGRARRAAFALLRAVPPLHFCAHLAAPANSVLAFKAA